jgi:hypothetical protein
VTPRGPSEDGVVRDIEHIAPEEIERAMSLVLEQALSLTEDELVTQTARAFGYARTGHDIEQALRTRIHQAEGDGRFARIDDRLQLARPE